jgi:hypothetical protein
MRFLSVAACALAASLLSAGPSQAIYVETHAAITYNDGYVSGGSGWAEYTIFGSIPEPINIGIGLYLEVMSPEVWGDFNNSFWGTATASTTYPNSYASIGFAHGPGGDRVPEFQSSIVTISDTDRTISVYVSVLAVGYIINDASVGFSLPDNLSIAAPVPEPSSWALLLLGFAGIALIRRRRVPAVHP